LEARFLLKWMGSSASPLDSLEVFILQNTVSPFQLMFNNNHAISTSYGKCCPVPGASF
jgi:hypothetical protein